MLSRIKHFFLQFPASILALTLYYLWWLLILVFNNKEYDNHAAGGMALVGLAIITIVLSLSILSGLIISIFITKDKRITYFLFVVILGFPYILLLTLN
jgi:hypothetical protein